MVCSAAGVCSVNSARAVFGHTLLAGEKYIRSSAGEVGDPGLGGEGRSCSCLGDSCSVRAGRGSCLLGVVLEVGACCIVVAVGVRGRGRRVAEEGLCCLFSGEI